MDAKSITEGEPDSEDLQKNITRENCDGRFSLERESENTITDQSTGTEQCEVNLHDETLKDEIPKQVSV